MRKLLFLAMLCPFLSMCQPLTIKGKIINSQGEPIAGATITVKRSANIEPQSSSFEFQTASDIKGEFTIAGIRFSDTLFITAVGYETVFETLDFNSRNQITIILKPKTAMLDEVVVNTGYQQLPKERATGSFDFIGREGLNRSASVSIIDRLENAAPGLLFNRADNQVNDPFTIRGRSTLFASSQPLIVLDNFPYDGDLSSINPADVESVTLLKDAAAASIWGARAGNGVIVITTKKGKTAKPRVEFNTSYTLVQKPDLFSVPVISSADFIELERFLYSKGFYNSVPNAAGQPPITPAVEWMLAQSAGTVSAGEANAQIEALKAFDVRTDIAAWLYRPALNQQYSLGLSGSNGAHSYYLSAGYDRNSSNLVGAAYNRVSLTAANTVRLGRRFEIEAGLRLITQTNTSGANMGYAFLDNGFGKSLYPYARLVNDEGAPVPLLRDYRASFAASPGPGLLPWLYNPIEDNNEVENTDTRRDYVLNASLKYNMLPFLSATLKYQYGYGQSTIDNLYLENSWYVRNLVNQYTQISPTGELTRPIPLGGILNRSFSTSASHQARAQLNFNRSVSGNNLTALAGIEVKQLSSAGNAWRYYGYQPDGSTVNTTIDYTTRFTRYDNPLSSAAIPYPASISALLDRFVSYFVNAAYNWKSRYILSASARQDASNLFGVRSNQQAVPLWSAGLGWNLYHEPFYKLSWLPRLTLRATYGYQGNISRRTSAFTTARYGSSTTTGAVTATIQNPPNERLRWEKLRTINLGLDFSLKAGRLSGSFDYFFKNATDLMGIAPVDPTWGLAGIGGSSEYFGNLAAMKGNGFEGSIQWRIFDKGFRWYTTLMGSYVSSRVTQYAMPASTLGMTYLLESTVNPVPGRPLFAIYSYPWAGLDPANGNPQGLLDGKVSTAHATIVTRTKLDSMIYHGSITPSVFGSFRNSFELRGFSLSFVWSYKLGYYFRRPSVHYANLFNTWTGHSDYARRWRQPGDEQFTTVPSLVYPSNSNRDRFYANSEILVERADHIRFEDINLSYNLPQKLIGKGLIQSLRVYLYARDLGTIWTANSKGIDPYFIKSPEQGPSWTLGLNAIF